MTPVGPKTTAPEWRAGNIYAMGRSPPNTVDFPILPSLDSPTTYELFLSGDYEVSLAFAVLVHVWSLIYELALLRSGCSGTLIMRIPKFQSCR